MILQKEGVRRAALGVILRVGLVLFPGGPLRVTYSGQVRRAALGVILPPILGSVAALGVILLPARGLLWVPSKFSQNVRYRPSKNP